MSPLSGIFDKILLGINGNENGNECFENPYDHFDTKIKSPTSRFGFIDPEGILKGSNTKDLIINAMNIAMIMDLKLLINLFLFFIRY